MRGHEDVAPAVLSPETMAPVDADQDLPETAYLPSERATAQDAEVTLELRDTTEGYRAMLAYSSLESLVECCGDGQPWVAVRGHQVDDLRERAGADVTLWDAALPVEERRARFQEGN